MFKQETSVALDGIRRAIASVNRLFDKGRNKAAAPSPKAEPSYLQKFRQNQPSANTPATAPAATPPHAPASDAAEGLRRRLAARRAAAPPSPAPAAPHPAPQHASQVQCEAGVVLRELGIDPGPLRNLEATAAGVTALRSNARWYKTRLAGARPEERARLQADAMQVLAKTPEPTPDAPAESERPATQLQCEAATAIRYAGLEPGDVNAIQATPEGVKALFGTTTLFRSLLSKARPDEKRRLENEVIETLAGRNGTANEITLRHLGKNVIKHECDTIYSRH